MKRVKKPLVLLLILLLLGSLLGNLTVFGATNAEINAIFQEITNDPVFMPKLYAAGANYASQGITNEFIDTSIKTFIGNILDDVRVLYKNGQINNDNFKDKLADVIVKRAYNLDVFMLAIIFDAFPNDSKIVLAKKVPPSFQSLYNALETKTKIIIGLVPGEIPKGPGLAKISDLPTLPPIIVGSLSPFSDMGDYAWAKDAVVGLSSLGIINGMSKDSFAPGENVTREQFAKMLAVAFKVDTANSKAKFSDVLEDSWYCPFVSAMADLGYVKGVGESLFGTGQDITRQDIAVLMFRMGQDLGVFSEISSSQEFADQTAIADYAKNAVRVLRSFQIVNGTPENYFSPEAPATRAEAAQMLYNFYKFITIKK